MELYSSEWPIVKDMHLKTKQHFSANAWFQVYKWKILIVDKTNKKKNSNKITYNTNILNISINVFNCKTK